MMPSAKSASLYWLQALCLNVHTPLSHVISTVFLGLTNDTAIAKFQFKIVYLCPRYFNISYWPNPSIRTVALGSTQSLTEILTLNLPEF
jgi:hypothetical protein